MINRVFFLCLTIIVILTSSCHDPIIETIEVEVPLVKAWQENESFRFFAKIRTNSLATEDVLLLDGPHIFGKIFPEGTVDFEGKRYHPDFYELPIHRHYFLDLNAAAGTVKFANVETPSGDDAQINFHTIEEGFVQIDLGSSVYDRVSIGISEEGQCLVPIRKQGVNDSLILYLFKVEPYSFLSLTIVTDTIRVAIAVEDLRINNTIGFEDYFLIATPNGVYKINNDGSYRQVIDSPSVLRFFRHRDKIYAIESNITQVFFTSSDEGESWTSKAGYPTPLYQNQSLGDSLVVFRFDRLYTLFLGEDFFRLRLLNNEGLEGAEITSIASFGDTVYVTTLSGVYQRGLDVFYEDF